MISGQSGSGWVVWRVDDHGHRFVVQSLPTEAEALRLAQELEARGHKQCYWVQPADPAERSV